MDDAYEQPTSLPERTINENADDQQSSGDEEEENLDWTKLPGIARPVIPRRGEKEFEPREGGGSSLQVHILDDARSAMFNALRANRTISNKTVSYAIWYPTIGRAHVTSAKGIHFSTMGHSVPRPMLDEKGIEKTQKRLELLPEEAIYLMEKGSLFCWKESDLILPNSGLLENMTGAPVTVQQAYAEMVGVENLTLERLQVYTYLKRLGYSVIRTEPPTSHYPIPPPWPSQSDTIYTKSSGSIIQRMISFFPCWMSKFFNLFRRSFDWWKPLRISRWLRHDKNYVSIFKSLRFLKAGHTIPLYHYDGEKRLEHQKESLYHIFYNVYKPSTPFKKSAPPPPDFQMVVINARTTPMPTLQELTDLFDVLPELPPPLPRQRQPLVAQVPIAHQNIDSTFPTPITAMTSASAVPHSVNPPSAVAQRTLLQRLVAWLYPSANATTHHLPPARRPHPFMALKAGKKIVVIAVVDAGNISFFRFGQGDFAGWPMI